MKIKAAVLHKMGLDRPYADSEPVKIEELDLDPPEEGEVLVRVTAAGICHSDLSVLEGVRPRPLPITMGHEGAGIVEDVGPGVDDLAPGDHVVFVFMPPPVASAGRARKGVPRSVRRGWLPTSPAHF